ncbi:MAG: DUF2752 domain-containing protein [Sporichthyaceae bacterium]|nr:DUF2752 domain-containing protein [Sporichthyaceae bacterium]
MATLPVRASRVVSLRGPSTVAVAASAVVVVLATVDPNEPGHYPTCPVLALTGRYCPGCGSLRAVHALAHGDVAEALSLNLLTVLAVVPLAVVWVQWVRRSWRGRQRSTVAPAAVLWGLLVVVAFFTVLRNLPVGSALAP